MPVLRSLLFLILTGLLAAWPVTLSAQPLTRNTLQPAAQATRGVLPRKPAAVAPLIKSRWGEGMPFNSVCPADTAATVTGLRVPAGSGAVAMAQVMKYYEYPAQGQGEHGYPDPVYGIQFANFGATNYHWELMTDSLVGVFADVPYLIYHCGVAQDMDYGPQVSVSQPAAIDSGLVKYFRYPASAAWKQRAGYTTAEWMALLLTELDASRPVIFSGTDAGGNGQRYFICDGYNAEGRFHFNWGMGGLYDGYYHIDTLKPGPYNLSYNQALLAGLAPPQQQEDLVMDFEETADWSLTFNGWTTADLDLHDTYGITGYVFPHQSEPMAYLCFNPAQVTPSMAGDAAIQPHGGQRFGACFSSNPPANNDWFISPQVQLGVNGTFSFWIKSYNDTYGLDSYRVAISVTDNDPASFTVISGDQPLRTTTSWTRKTFNLSAWPNQKVYLAIQCVSSDNFLMMIDDLVIQPQVTASVTADFSADKTNPRVGGTVNFTDQSSGGPIAWHWTFGGGIPATSTEQNPSGIRYDVPGNYPVTLRVSNGPDSDSITREGYITVAGYPVTADLDFESVTDFSLTFGDWTALDVKGGHTYGINQPNGQPYYFLHVNEPMAYICFNPSATTPPITSLVAHGGSKLGCSFSSVPPMNPNDKWLISPRVSLGLNARIEFWVQAFNNLYGDEKYNVAVSLTGTDPSDFTRVNGAAEVAPIDWTRRSYDLSYYDNQDVYVAIQCVTDNSFIFMIDDIHLGSSLGTGETTGSAVPVVFPNPASDRLVINLKRNLDGPVNLTLIHPGGGMVKSRVCQFLAGMGTIGVEDVPPGLYILLVEDSSGPLAMKINIVR